MPWLIKRNTALFALCQTFTGAGMQFAYGFGPLMVVQLTGSAGLAGMSIALIGFSRFLVAYPVGRITDTYGRRPGIMLGLVLALIGAVTVGLAMNAASIVMLGVGMLVFSMGMSAAQQLRVAATDMFPPHHRAQALGYVAMGSLVGLAISPAIVAHAEAIAKDWGQDPLGLPWLMLPGLIIPGMLLVLMVRPDPKEIGMNLQRYYPDYQPPARRTREAAEFTVAGMLDRDRVRMAIVSNCAAQGNMTLVMVLTSLVLSHHGHSLAAIAFSHMFHSAGMFAFTIPLGRLTDRIGHDRVMYPGVATALVGAALVAFTIRLLVRHARHFPCRTRLGGGQRRGHGARRGCLRDPGAGPRDRCQRKPGRRRQHGDRAGCRTIDPMGRAAGDRRCSRRHRRPAAAHARGSIHGRQALSDASAGNSSWGLAKCRRIGHRQKSSIAAGR